MSRLKDDLRRLMLQKRDSLDSNYVKESSKQIIDKIISLAEFSSARSILLYSAIRNEVELERLMLKAWQLNKNVCLPKVAGGHLQIYKVMPKDELYLGPYNILEPAADPDKYVPYEKLELLIVPAVAIDKSNYRLGYGGGYYDKMLGSARKENRNLMSIGVAHDFQLVESTYPQGHDIKLDLVLTSDFSKS